MAIYWYIFFFGLTSTAWRIRGYSVGVGPVPDVNFVLENEYKLYNAPVPEGYVIFWIPASVGWDCEIQPTQIFGRLLYSDDRPVAVLQRNILKEDDGGREGSH